ncbi:CHC2 zinc finger domain-containing protein [Serratia symbiotica]|nr:CHC2 zinc finger domain-containing protein [Serratia symbiotica]USS96005.1 CHC2 zinc finger domain-containing protein [Serratia symbiotica]
MPPAELEQLKRDVSLLKVDESQGHSFKKHGKDGYTCLCPFHGEKTPSCVISPAKSLYHYFGCGAERLVLDWLQHTDTADLPANPGTASGTGGSALGCCCCWSRSRTRHGRQWGRIRPPLWH